MNSDQLINLIQKLLTAGGAFLAAKGLGSSSLWETVVGCLMAGVTWYVSHRWNAAPPAMAPVSVGLSNKQSGFARLGLLLFVAALCSVTLLCLIQGCAAIQKGNDPLVVNVERTETIARDTFDMVLSIDNSQRDFYRNNAPAFHNFCEWLRQPQSVPDVDGKVVSLPRDLAMLLSLDNVKLDYKAARASSNDVFTALQTVTGAMAQANAWLNTGVATNTIPKLP